MSKFCKLLNAYYDWRSPPKEGVYSREFTSKNVADKAVHYYHLRGFMYKWPVWTAKKSIFPWMVIYVLRDMAGNNIHRDAYYGDAYVCLEFSNLAEGAVIDNAAVISSHVVDSIFGNLTVKQVSVERNATMYPTAIMAPGGEIAEDHAVGPRSFVPKNWHLDSPETHFVWGVPAKQSEYFNFLDRLPLEFQKQWEEKQHEFAQK